MVALGKRLEELERPAAEDRRASTQAKPGERIGGAESAPPIENKGKTRDKVSEALGVGRTKLAKAKEVVKAAEEGDPVAEEAREEMDRTGNVEKAHRKVASSPEPPPAVTKLERPKAAERQREAGEKHGREIAPADSAEPITARLGRSQQLAKPSGDSPEACKGENPQTGISRIVVDRTGYRSKPDFSGCGW